MTPFYIFTFLSTCPLGTPSAGFGMSRPSRPLEQETSPNHLQSLQCRRWKPPKLTLGKQLKIGNSQSYLDLLPGRVQDFLSKP